MKKRKNKTKNNILLEIGTEPLPANSIYSLIKQLKNNAQRILKKNNIIFEEVESFDTYRRLVVLVKNVEEYQKASEIEVRGPSKEIAFDENDKPTKAFFGFLKKTGLKQIDVDIRKTDQGEYLYGLKKEPAKKVKLILAVLLKSIINSVACEKNMRWGKGCEFIRPIRWILALWNDEIVKFELAQITSGNITYGHQVLSPKPIKVKEIPDYFKTLKKHYVVFDFNKRRELIEKQILVLVKRYQGYLSSDGDLLDEVSNLVEYPDLILGKFNKNFLSLPDEILKTSMKKGQKLFAVQDKNTKVMPLFIAVIDNKPTSKAKSKIRSNYESILAAKLKDSIFFLTQDNKKPLKDKVDSLSEIIFQKDLGNMFDKAQRLIQLSRYISQKLNLSEDTRRKIERCAFLSKADLTTHMVGEFPDLQGRIGYQYALASKEDKAVAKGILEHYLPKSADDEVPQSIIGAVVAIADKIDTLTSCFSIRLIPSGSYDPYALRRNAYGWVRIILEKRFSLSLDEVLDTNLALLENVNTNINREETKKRLKEFLCQRLKQIISQKISRYDLIEAVLSSDYDDFLDLVERLQQLERISKSKKFFECSKVVERTANILKKAPKELPKINPKLFKENLEEELYKLYIKSKEKIEESIKKKDYKEVTEIYADTFFQPIHVFFNKVLINVDNAKIRDNRLTLMKSINKLYTENIADLSKINF